MTYPASNPSEYIAAIPEERREAFSRLRETILENLPDGFEECMGYGMVGYAVPHRHYPAGYHCDPKQPLPFAGIASQKHFIALYHMGLYADEELLQWFVGEYPKHSKAKLDMGKSCVRFKKIEQIPYALVAQLMQKISMDEWVERYESKLKR